MEIVHPNRDKAVVRSTRAVVVVLLLLSAALVLVISIGGVGAQETAVLPVQYAFVIVFLLVAWMAMRWRMGSLPIGAAIGVLLIMFALIAGSSWFHREHSYFASSSLNPSLLGVLTFATIPVELLLIAFALRGFRQGWNVEVERPISRGDGPPLRANTHAAGAGR